MQIANSHHSEQLKNLILTFWNGMVALKVTFRPAHLLSRQQTIQLRCNFIKL